MTRKNIFFIQGSPLWFSYDLSWGYRGVVGCKNAYFWNYFFTKCLVCVTYTLSTWWIIKIKFLVFIPLPYLLFNILMYDVLQFNIPIFNGPLLNSKVEDTQHCQVECQDNQLITVILQFLAVSCGNLSVSCCNLAVSCSHLAVNLPFLAVIFQFLAVIFNIIQYNSL